MCFKHLYKKILSLLLILALTIPANAAVSVSDGSAFVSKAEFSTDITNLSNRMAQLENSLDAKIDSLVSSYLSRNGIWNGEAQKLNSVFFAQLFNASTVFLTDGYNSSFGGYISDYIKGVQFASSVPYLSDSGYYPLYGYTFGVVVPLFKRQFTMVDNLTKSGMVSLDLAVDGLSQHCAIGSITFGSDSFTTAEWTNPDNANLFTKYNYNTDLKRDVSRNGSDRAGLLSAYYRSTFYSATYPYNQLTNFWIDLEIYSINGSNKKFLSSVRLSTNVDYMSMGTPDSAYNQSIGNRFYSLVFPNRSNSVYNFFVNKGDSIEFDICGYFTKNENNAATYWFGGGNEGNGAVYSIYNNLAGILGFVNSLNVY